MESSAIRTFSAIQTFKGDEIKAWQEIRALDKITKLADTGTRHGASDNASMRCHSPTYHNHYTERHGTGELKGSSDRPIALNSAHTVARKHSTKPVLPCAILFCTREATRPSESIVRVSPCAFSHLKTDLIPANSGCLDTDLDSVAERALSQRLAVSTKVQDQPRGVSPGLLLQLRYGQRDRYKYRIYQ